MEENMAKKKEESIEYILDRIDEDTQKIREKIWEESDDEEDSYEDSDDSDDEEDEEDEE
jgi:hypothetical protein